MSTVVTDSTADLARDVQRAYDGSDGVIVASGLETASGSESRDYLRRTSFRRSTLSQLPCPVILVLSEATWAWLALELPDLVRWFDGPFVAPVPEKRSSLQHSRPFVGYPIPPSEDVALDGLRGLATPMSEHLEEAESRLVVLGGPPGVGLTHFAARLQQERASRAARTVWPPGVSWINGQKRVSPLNTAVGPETALKTLGASPTIREWLEEAESDAFLIVPRGWLPDAGIAWLAELRGGIVLGTAQQGLSTSIGRARTVYIPPVYLHGDNDLAECGRVAMTSVLSARIRAAGFDQDSLITSGALARIAQLSGGVPGIAIELLSNCHETADRLPIDEEDVRHRALDLAASIQAGGGPTRFDTHHRQLVYAPDGPREVEHPLVRLRAEQP